MQRPNNRSSTNSNTKGDVLERQIQAELNHRRLNQAIGSNQKRLGSDFLNDLKLPNVDLNARPGHNLGNVNQRG